jgi:hypothetical protein
MPEKGKCLQNAFLAGQYVQYSHTAIIRSYRFYIIILYYDICDICTTQLVPDKTSGDP